MVCQSWWDALTHTIYGTGKKQGEIAAALNRSPSELSRMCNHPDDENRRAFDIRDVERLMQFTADISLLETWAARLGYEVIPNDEGVKITEKMDEVIEVLQRAKRIVDAAGEIERRGVQQPRSEEEGQ